MLKNAGNFSVQTDALVSFLCEFLSLNEARLVEVSQGNAEPSPALLRTLLWASVKTSAVGVAISMETVQQLVDQVPGQVVGPRAVPRAVALESADGPIASQSCQLPLIYTEQLCAAQGLPRSRGCFRRGHHQLRMGCRLCTKFASLDVDLLTF